MGSEHVQIVKLKSSLARKYIMKNSMTGGLVSEFFKDKILKK